MKDDVVAVGYFSPGINSGCGFIDGFVTGGKLANVVVRAIDFNPRRCWLKDGRCRAAGD
ncbi:MAG: hypothetical protein ABSD56_12150 [Bryobacteraceae bacterium]